MQLCSGIPTLLYDIIFIIMKKEVLHMKKVILFDGECNFCNYSVQFIIKRDPTGHFSFASLQSKVGKKLMSTYQIPQNIDSLLLIDHDKWFSKSSAVFRICKHLNGFWKLFFLLLVVPKPIRDFFYNIISNNRYKLWGKQDSCIFPTAEIKNRFL